MKNKFKFLVKVSLKRKINTKWFKIANIILAILIIGLINIDKIIGFFGGDFNDTRNVYVIDQTTSDVFELFNKQVNDSIFSQAYGDSAKYVVTKYDKTEEDITKLLKEDKEEKKSVVIIFTDSQTDILGVKMISNDNLGVMDLPSITNSINNVKIAVGIGKYNITQEQIDVLSKPVNIERLVLNEQTNSTDENMEIIMSTAFPIIILPFFMLSLFLVQMIGAEVNDEKTTKAMEMIISNVSPKAHFFAKVVAGNVFVITQGLLLVVFLALGLLVRYLTGGLSISGDMGASLIETIKTVINTNLGSNIWMIVVFTLVLMLLTFVAYSLLAGVLASMTTNIEDFQQLQTPIIIISLIGYYLAMMAGVFEGALFIKILGYIPFISAILSPSLLVLGQFTVFDMVISITLMGITLFALMKYGLKIYKVGILNYSSTDLWKKMFKAVKE